MHAFAFAGILIALGAVMAVSWRWLGTRARREAAREAELEDWARADLSPPAP